MLIYLSTTGEARAVVNQMELKEMQEPGGLGRVLRLLEDAYGARADERFEERQEAFLTYRRQPGCSMAAYLATLKRLRQEYLKEDGETVISDKSFAQRMLSRAGLTKRERMDVFFSAGGRYASNGHREGPTVQMRHRSPGGRQSKGELQWRQSLRIKGCAQKKLQE